MFNFSQSHLEQLLKINRHYWNLFKNIRLIVAKDHDQVNIVLGRVGTLVEIDESLFVRVNHNHSIHFLMF